MFQRRLDKRLTIALIALGLTVSLPGQTAATDPHFAEDWETAGLPGWTTDSGISQDCNIGADGCSLKISPPCCDTHSTASHALQTPLADTLTVFVKFRGTESARDTDVSMGVDGDTGHLFALGFTDGVSPNNRVRLTTPDGDTGVFFEWADGTWYQFGVTIDPALDTVRVGVYDAQGLLIDQSTAVALPNANSLASIAFSGVMWHGTPGPYRFDTLRIVDGNYVGGGPGQPADGWVSAPRDVVVTPERVFDAGAVQVSFAYDSRITGCSVAESCPSASEWRVLQGGTAQDGNVTNADLTGDVASGGVEVQPAQGETQENQVETTVVVAAAPGTHLIKVAVRAPWGDDTATWSVKTVSVEVMTQVDADNDAVPDALESEVCGRSVFANTIAMFAGSAGECVTTTDYETATHSVSLIAPTHVTTGEDADGDGFPSAIIVSYSNVTIGTDGNTISPAGRETYVVDHFDDNPNYPAPVVVCIPVNMPSGIALGPDGDADGFAAWMEVGQTQVCVDRRDGSIEQDTAATLLRMTVDPDDSDPNMPVQSIITVADIPVGARYHEDSDDDGIPAGITRTLMDVTVDRRTPTAAPQHAFREAFTAVDTDDDDRNSPVPLLGEIDADKDMVPDSSETFLCGIENQNDGLDGSCSGGTNYHPTSWYQALIDTLWASF